MNLQLQRYSDNGNSTQGLLHEVNAIDWPQFLAYTIEDEHRTVKLAGETCIPAGLYEVRFRKELTTLTRHYRDKFDWFTWHLEVCNVPGFKNVYIHVGNTEKDTAGCLLLADNANNNTVEKGFNGKSTVAFRRIYLKVSEVLLNEEKVFIRIKDVPALLM